MNRFMELVNESIIFRGLLALILVISGVWLVANGREVPEWFAMAIGAAMGYFFGAPLSSQVARAMKREVDGWSQKQD